MESIKMQLNGSQSIAIAFLPIGKEFSSRKVCMRQQRRYVKYGNEFQRVGYQ